VAEAVTITLTTFGASNVTVGSAVTVKLSVSGLGNGVAPSLGSFDVDIAFDPTLISFSDVSFASPSQLALDAGSLQDSGVIPIGANESRVDVSETSLDTPETLNDSQLDAFLLATLEFTGLSTGTATFSFAQIVLGDAEGATLPASGAVVVPEPSGFLLAGLASAALLLRTRRRRA
jgi:hypothetical protein